MLKQNSTIGILGGGQLGRMTCHAAQKLGFKTIVFSDIHNSPASQACKETIVADYDDWEVLKEFTDQINVATFEFENIPVGAVDFVAGQKPVYPSSAVLKITQNRLNEKKFINSIGIKTADYLPINSLQDLQDGFKQFSTNSAKLAVLKTTTMGYDGKGQKVLSADSDLKKIWKDFEDEELILEKFVPFKSEASVIVARGLNGEIACYEPLTNIHENGILRKSIYPSNLEESTVRQAKEYAQKIAEKLDLIGLLAIEFFVLDNGDLLVNELAPRPHNSGHFSMDASYTSQFEQLVRAITGMPLGNPNFHSSGFMQNLIGDDILQIDEALKNKNAKLHLYGKDKIAVGRKMGHINFLNSEK